MSQLRKREFRFPLKARIEDPKLRGFHKPQRDHIKQPMPPRKP